MNNSKIAEILKTHLIPSDRYICGFANLKGLLPEKFNGYSFGISIGRKLDDQIVEGIRNAPTLEYFLHYSEINKELLALSEQIAHDLTSVGIDAIPIIPTVPTSSREFDEFLPTLRYEVSQKMVATRAGLGWIGKTDLFISKSFGARLRLGSILINQEVQPESKPINKSRCGNCSVCVQCCPAKAANGQLWDIYTDRDVFFDAFKCREQCDIFGKTHLKIDKRICGICVAACPIGVKKKAVTNNQ
jgi:epoxyqueuosine reductase